MKEDECKSGEGCGCCCHEEEDDFGGMMVDVAEDAWTSVVQGKIEAMIEKEDGKGLDKVARIILEHTRAIWKAKMAGKELPKGAEEEFEKRLMAAMGGK
ncbi:MAG: hypothetical protein WC263_01075 [Candidatus Micrarchaeia archaeon]|jgi:hypothetical protein